MEHMEHSSQPRAEMREKKDFTFTFDKKSFWVGAIAGIMALCVAGFFILLAIMLSGASFGSDQVLKKTSAATNPSVAADPNAAPTDVSIPDISAEDNIRGDKNAQVTIVEYSDIDCPFCKRFHVTLTDIIKNNGKNVNWVYRHFPLATLHPDATKKAEASECVADLGGNDAFWKFLDLLMVDAGVPLAQLGDAAAKAGVDKNKFQTCFDNGTYADLVQQQYNDAVAAGGRGTPFSVLVGKSGELVPISGALPIEQVQQALDSLLNS